MDHTTAKKAANALIFIGVLLLLSLYLFVDSTAFNTLMLIVFLLAFCLFTAGIVIMVKFYRCPHCNSPIRVKGRTPDYCPECGEDI